ncbi:50S ribosomal protein L32 [Candidatus Nardonella dryophthoridicola]|uniref:Large ribosomal subunit protein bL32 n=1 Tax=endosymbiont of Rhynchophorus ferrugineus TaxID=1972133 RepID=A0A2Z5T3M4_9GAMM|nr:50S ribosomal protein L32 [Candidatus Nardonella dryophthoridicola]QTJ62950.1 50S ribosomal protein L32 [Candidatus Nardonella dryophthoridicola]BBA85001.1 50S ribosomal protein L32 [endosymbiont of Rhynchophorus ferrugineus]
MAVQKNRKTKSKKKMKKSNINIRKPTLFYNKENNDINIFHFNFVKK